MSRGHVVPFGADVENSILQGTRLGPHEAFVGLSLQERNQLRAWQTAARSIGIDAVEDLATRPWPCPIEGSVLGVFQTGDTTASWMVIGQNGTWAVAFCDDGSVSATYHSLAEALAAIFSAN